MSRPRQSLLLASLLAGLGSAALPPAQAAPDNPGAIARAADHITRFRGQSQHGPDDSYTATDVVVDPDGTEHVRFDRRHRGLRVVGGDLVVHTSSRGVLREMTRSLDRPLAPAPRAGLQASQATAAALAGRTGYVASGVPELVVHARQVPAELAYEVLLSGMKSDGTPSELHVFVSGRDGRVLESWDGIETAATVGSANGKGFFSGVVSLTTDSGTQTTTVNGVKTTVNGWYLRDPSRGNQYTINMANRTSGGSVFFSKTNAWGNGLLTNAETVGVDAQYGTAVTWDYYRTVHQRNGIANDGKGAYNRVHYSSRYNNAFWSDTCFCMTYGDGDGVNFNPFDSLDVAGHEMSHGLTSKTAKLVYSGESGGLNEATSDIFGTAVEYFAANAQDVPDYLIGERLYKVSGRYIRSMVQPSLDGLSADCWYPGLGTLDVHYSSGVANHFFYLLAEGTDGLVSKTCSPTDTRVANNAGLQLVGIGRLKAEKIWYRALTVYMTSSTNYAAARAATSSAATDLYGAGSPEAVAVATAWSAVRVN